MTRGPGPTGHIAGALAFECEEGEPPRAPVARFLGDAAEDREGKFLKTNAAVSRRLARGPAKPSSMGATHQSAARTGTTVDVTDGRLTARAR